MKFFRSCVILLCILSLVGCNNDTNSETENNQTSHSDYSVQNDVNKKSVLFKGTQTDSNALCTVNSKEFKPSLFCSSIDGMFFSWDGAVYSYDGAEEKKLFEANAFDLNYLNGSLYYIANNSYELTGGDLVSISGIPYKYELSSGIITQLCDTPISKMVVSEDGIFWTDYAYETDDTDLTGICRLNEETGQSERLYNGFSYIEYNGLQLKFETADGGLQYMFFDENGEYLLDNVNPSSDCIDGSNYYYVSMTDGTLNCISMLTGENTATVRYSDDMLPENSEKKFSYSDYTVLNDEIYFSDSTLKLCRYDASAQTINEYTGDDGFMYLYSDGENIYTVYKLYNGAIPELHFGKVIIDGSHVKVDAII